MGGGNGRQREWKNLGSQAQGQVPPAFSPPHITKELRARGEGMGMKVAGACTFNRSPPLAPVWSSQHALGLWAFRAQRTDS